MKSIDDMYSAAALLSYGVKLETINRDDPKRYAFLFNETIKRVYILEDGVMQIQESPTIDEVETLFVGRNLLFPPTYPDAIKRIKAAIHSR